jgi:hypothetical protein
MSRKVPRTRRSIGFIQGTRDGLNAPQTALLDTASDAPRLAGRLLQLDAVSEAHLPENDEVSQ